MGQWSQPIEPAKPIDIAVKGIVVVGEYVGFETFINSASGEESRIYEVRISKEARVPEFGVGDYVRFWSTKDLDMKLRRVKVRDLVRLEYTGTTELGGDRTMKVFEVRRSSPDVGSDERWGAPPPTDEPPY